MISKNTKIQLWLVFSLGTLAFGGILSFFIKDLPPVQKLDNYSPSQMTKIYDVRGQLITGLFIEKRTTIPLPDIPKNMQNAVIATEDKRFYKHAGVDTSGIARALLAAGRHGRFVQGASTLTQQLARNVFLTRERTLSRKIKEVLLTFQMENNLSKEEILQLYLNQIYFGHGAYGLESAAQTFFQKSAKQLTLPECALLAGIPKGPERYSPIRHLDRALQRRNWVLKRMRKEGYITEEEEEKASQMKPTFEQRGSRSANASYFIEETRMYLESTYGGADLYKKGLSVYTTLDLRLQAAAEMAMDKHLTAFDTQYEGQRMDVLLKNKKITKDYFDRWTKWKKDPTKNKEPTDGVEPVPVQGAFVAIDPHTGGIRALVGGRDFQESQFNRALHARRQPGSTFKTFVWLAALESGLTAATVEDDLPLAYAHMETKPERVAEAPDTPTLKTMVESYYQEPRKKGDPDPIWAPQNWDLKFLGPITLRRGLALSRNLVSVRLIDRVSPAAAVELAHRCGIQSPLDAVLSLALGSTVVTPVELVSSFGTFANNGVHMRPVSLLKVVDSRGKILEETPPQGDPPISAQSTYLITRLLEAVVSEGTGAYAKKLGRPVAGKTGTTDSNRDVWFVGYSPDLVAGVWIGYDDFLPLGKRLSSSSTTVPLWTDFMQEALKTQPVRDFQVPPGIVFSKTDRDTGLLALPTCPHVLLEAFRTGQAPTTFCPVDHERDTGPEQPVDLE